MNWRDRDMIKPGTVVEFDKKKHFTHVSALGQGGTGETHLFKDETTDMLFAFKKYAPKDLERISEHYDRFVDEIKILFTLSHPNIVRVYNYYLYPEYKLGYLQMEYIDGDPITEFKPIWKSWKEIFSETIAAFEYLESNKVLHRDIRPDNILIDRQENVKVIDFGFGKKLAKQDKDGRSVFLNWPVTQLPNEIIYEKVYNHQSEIYFVGKLFNGVFNDSFPDFKHIIDKMTQLDPKRRYTNFREVLVDISQGVLAIEFTEEEKSVYLNLAEVLSHYIISHSNSYDPIEDPDAVMTQLSKLIKNSSLEEFLQNNTKLINCFINNDYTYKLTNDISISIISDFYKLLQGLSSDKRKIVLDNINIRLSKIEINIVIDDSDLPF